MNFVKSWLFLLFFCSLTLGQIFELMEKLEKVVNFVSKHQNEINFDGLLGLTIAEAQLKQIKLEQHQYLKTLLKEFETNRQKIEPNLPKTPPKMLVLQKFLLKPEAWMINTTFKNNNLEKLPIYNWTVSHLLNDKTATFKGIPSDYCLMQILDQNCHISPFCNEMMLSARTDEGYLLSHRLFYLQIIRLKNCNYHQKIFNFLTKKFCSLMLREASTNDHLGFPAQDIFLEQIVLCGIEGFIEFLNSKWRTEIMDWQTEFGCFKSKKDINLKRSSNIISYGCSDHTTGLGAAALALHLRFLLYTNSNTK